MLGVVKGVCEAAGRADAWGCQGVCEAVGRGRVVTKRCNWYLLLQYIYYTMDAKFSYNVRTVIGKKAINATSLYIMYV